MRREKGGVRVDRMNTKGTRQWIGKQDRIIKSSGTEKVHKRKGRRAINSYLKFSVLR